jgi:CAAX protease family protein
VNARQTYSTRLAFWIALIALLTLVQFYGRYIADEADLDDPLYSSSFAAASLFQWILFGAVTLGIAGGVWSLFALRRPRLVGRAALVALGTFLLTASVGALLSLLSLNPAEEQGLVPDEWPPPDNAVFAINVALVVIVGPFVEEMLFRGVGFSLLRPYGRRVAVVGSAAAFAAVHGLLEGFILVFVLGLGLAIMRELTNSTIPGFVLHATFNAIAIAGAAASAAGS